MVIYKCDRCQKEIPEITSRNQKYDIYRNRLYVEANQGFLDSGDVIHLCPHCTSELDDFLNGKAVKPYLFGNHIESVAVDDELIGPMGGFHDN